MPLDITNEQHVQNMTSTLSDLVGSWKPSKARQEFRVNPAFKGVSTTGFCMGHLQATVAILQSSFADDFEQFCELNRAPCPLLYKSKRGEVTAGHLAPDCDVRTDLPKYCVNKDGVITEETEDLLAFEWDDLVSFYVGCSTGFEGTLAEAGIPLRNTTEKRSVSMYETNLQCISVGPFASPLIVSMRPVPTDMVEKALIITAALEDLHGAPVHIGDPSVIGIEDLYNTEFGEPSNIKDLVPMFWACGRSTSLAIRAAKFPLSFCHFPGSVFICDLTVDEYFKEHKPEHGDEQPRLVTLTDQPYLASVCSASAMNKVEELAKISASSCIPNVTADAHAQIPGEFLKIAVRLSHAPSIVIGFLNEKESFSSETSVSEVIQAVISLIKALEALNKKVTIVTEYNAELLQESIVENAAKGHLISQDCVCIVECGHNNDKEYNGLLERVYKGKINPRLDTMIGLEAEKSPLPEKTSNITGGLVNTLFKEANISRIVSIKITADKSKTLMASADEVSSVDSHTLTSSSLKVAGCGLAAALYVLNNCPIHSRYVRRGIGKRPVYQTHQFVMNAVEDEVNSEIFQVIGES